MKKMDLFKAISTALLSLSICACSTVKRDGAPSGHFDPSRVKAARPRPLAKSHFGNPHSYVVFGKRYYVLNNAKGYKKRGTASWYGTKFHGRLTSTREPYDMYAMTAASPELPIPCFARVTNLRNHKSAIVKVNDRGPFANHRILDLSYAAAHALGVIKHGTAWVEVEALGGTRPHPYSKPLQEYLQVAAFKSSSEAKEKQRTLRRYFPHVKNTIQSAYIKHHSWFRVQLGPINPAKIGHLRQQLNDAGFHHFFTVIR